MIQVRYKTFNCSCGTELKAPQNPLYDAESIHTVDIKCHNCEATYFYNFKENRFLEDL